VITGNHSHLLDHLAPIAFYLNIPLLLTESQMVHLCNTFYPQVKCFLVSEPDLLPYIAKQFDSLFISVITWNSELQFIFKTIYQKKIRLIYCPHGNSDKGAIIPHLESDDIALIYGKQMKDRLKSRKQLFRIGNIRLSFYHEHKSFYTSLIEKELFPKLSSSNKTLLYAPTWQDSEDSSTFFDLCAFLCENKPANYNLIIKLHPLLEERQPGHTFHLTETYKDFPHLLFLTHFPLIYPLLERSDCFLGDYSAVGYDFLFFNRPMYFFQKNDKASFLHCCGKKIHKKEKIYEIIEFHEKDERYSKKREQIYRYAFDEAIIFKRGL